MDGTYSMQNLHELLEKIVGLTVTEVVSGGSNGSIIVIGFGSIETEYTILISCSWRLQFADEVLASSNDESNPNSNLVVQTRLLEGSMVRLIDLNDFFDLNIYFLSGKQLRVFCDVTAFSGYEEGENWYVADIHKNECLIINDHFKILESKYR